VASAAISWATNSLRFAPRGTVACVADQFCAVSYEIFSDEALTKRVQRGEFITHARRGWSVHVRAQGLRPDQPYWYRFQSGAAQSTVGRTRTAPAPDAAVSRLRLALASCQHYEQGHYAAHADMARQDLALVLFVGDYIYESTAKRLAQPHMQRSASSPGTCSGST
jgi:alkaline phosphatase D